MTCRVVVVLTAAVLVGSVTGCGGSANRPVPRQEYPLPADASPEVQKAIEGLNSPDPQRRAHSAASLASVQEGRDIATSSLLLALHDGNHLVRSRAAEALGEMRAPTAIEPLIKLLEDRFERPEVRAATAEALGMLEAHQAVPALLASIRDAVWFVRYQTVVALGRIGDPSAVDALQRTVRYEANALVRKGAEDSLRQLGATTPPAAGSGAASPQP